MHSMYAAVDTTQVEFRCGIYFHWSFYTPIPREEQMLHLLDIKQRLWKKKLHMYVYLPALQQLMSCQLPERQTVKTHQKLFNPVRARHMQSVRNQSVSKCIKLAYHIKPHLHSSIWPYVTPDIRTVLYCGRLRDSVLDFLIWSFNRILQKKLDSCLLEELCRRLRNCVRIRSDKRTLCFLHFSPLN